MTQREKINYYIKTLSHTVPSDANCMVIWEKLEDVVAEAQNQKKYGGYADGSVSEEFWYKARNFSSAYRNMIVLLEDIKPRV